MKRQYLVSVVSTELNEVLCSDVHNLPALGSGHHNKALSELVQLEFDMDEHDIDYARLAADIEGSVEAGLYEVMHALFDDVIRMKLKGINVVRSNMEVDEFADWSIDIDLDNLIDELKNNVEGVFNLEQVIHDVSGCSIYEVQIDGDVHGLVTTIDIGKNV